MIKEPLHSENTSQTTGPHTHRPLHIALIRSIYTDFGGAEQAVVRTMQALGSSEVKVTLVTRKWNSSSQVDTLICNPFYIGGLWRDWGFASAVCGALRKRKFDLVQSHERVPCCDVYRAGNGIHLEWLEQRQRQWGIWGRMRIALNPYHHFVAAIERRLFESEQLRAVICNSIMVKMEILKWFSIKQEKLHVIYSGVDTERFHPRLRELYLEAVRLQHRIPVDGTVFLYVGSGFERKGLPQLLKAMQAMPLDCYLVVVGKDKGARRAERLAHDLGVLGRVRFVGPLKDVTGIYGAADVFVLPTLYDPFPNVILEAMACGLPVITSTKSGGAEFIESGVNGYVCDALDQPGLQQCMRQVLSPEIREPMRRLSRQKVEPYTLKRMSDSYIELYRSLLDKTS